jgi:hypothetical protein
MYFMYFLETSKRTLLQMSKRVNNNVLKRKLVIQILVPLATKHPRTDLSFLRTLPLRHSHNRDSVRSKVLGGRFVVRLRTQAGAGMKKNENRYLKPYGICSAFNIRFKTDWNNTILSNFKNKDQNVKTPNLDFFYCCFFSPEGLPSRSDSSRPARHDGPLGAGVQEI